ncbi:Gfo/Idh/MocA family protein [Natrononativus amylolyticus]|uniref:Gfo/Idh/MocA family protein n=1 Tax=Natrononativus amylolyticus TaxID=2963434 RepID=UPI0020CBCC65|nr:Gfo/Idh/MocA family oxidoreductase [Natrononativus amylolyticus]
MTVDTPPTTESQPVRAGVIGVGAMGENHARVYSELRDVELVGVTDLDTELAERVAYAYGTAALPLEDLLEAVDVATVAVPTHAHYETVSTCLDAGVHVLVEKPIADTLERGRALATHAEDAGLVLQVGHIERFNPAVQTVAELIDDLEVIAIDAERLGPPVDRTAIDGVTDDLMIHDVDVVSALLGAQPTSIAAAGTDNGQYATAKMRYDDVIVSLTASRLTQKKIRRFTVTATECLLEVDYLEQSVLIHRDSYPEYVTDNGRKRYRHESVIERPRIENGEPLRRELESFVHAARTGGQPEVTAEDGLEALETIQRINRLVRNEEPEVHAQ